MATTGVEITDTMISMIPQHTSSDTGSRYMTIALLNTPWMDAVYREIRSGGRCIRMIRIRLGSCTDAAAHTTVESSSVTQRLELHLYASALFLVLLVIGTACGTPDMPADSSQPAATVSSQRNSARSVNQAPLTSTASTHVSDIAPPATVTSAHATTSVSMHDCSGTVFVSVAAVGSLDELAWMSERIVVGTVVSQGEPEWGPAPNPLEPGRPFIVTPYVVAVSEVVRGAPLHTLTVGQFGGTVGGCSQIFEPQTPFQVGDRVLLFVRGDPAIPTLHGQPAYFPISFDFGVWWLNGDIVVQTVGGPYSTFESQPIDVVIERIVTSLAGSPPLSPFAEEFVPVEVSPPAVIPTVGI
jgi:hypothetical protein